MGKRKTAAMAFATVAVVIAGCAGPSSPSMRPVEPRRAPLVVPVTPEPPEPIAAPTVEISTSLVIGIASFVDPSYGADYLALPGGRGISATICHAERCVHRVSNDAGPALFMQRRGRIADLSFADFAFLCTCPPYAVGLIRVTVETGGAPTLPPTDEGMR